jgi:hypothetical protein
MGSPINVTATSSTPAVTANSTQSNAQAISANSSADDTIYTTCSGSSNNAILATHTNGYIAVNATSNITNANYGTAYIGNTAAGNAIYATTSGGSTSGSAVYASYSGTGSSGNGVYATSNSSGGYAVYASNSSGEGLYASSGGSNGIECTTNWQVTGIRKDAIARASRVVVERDKPPRERGRYRHAREHGEPISKNLGWPAISVPRAPAAKP